MARVLGQFSQARLTTTINYRMFDKFAYLRGYLEGPAKSTIAGLSLTSTNYQCAIDLLKKRFDKKTLSNVRM